MTAPIQYGPNDDWRRRQHAEEQLRRVQETLFETQKELAKVKAELESLKWMNRK